MKSHFSGRTGNKPLLLLLLFCHIYHCSHHCHSYYYHIQHDFLCAHIFCNSATLILTFHFLNLEAVESVVFSFFIFLLNLITTIVSFQLLLKSIVFFHKIEAFCGQHQYFPNNNNISCPEVVKIVKGKYSESSCFNTSLVVVVHE